MRRFYLVGAVIAGLFAMGATDQSGVGYASQAKQPPPKQPPAKQPPVVVPPVVVPPVKPPLPPVKPPLPAVPPIVVPPVKPPLPPLPPIVVPPVKPPLPPVPPVVIPPKKPPLPPLPPVVIPPKKPPFLPPFGKPIIVLKPPFPILPPIVVLPPAVLVVPNGGSDIEPVAQEWGMKITQVAANGAAAAGNLQVGHIIVSVGDKRVQSFDELTAILAQANGSLEIVVLIAETQQLAKTTVTPVNGKIGVAVEPVVIK